MGDSTRTSVEVARIEAALGELLSSASSGSGVRDEPMYGAPIMGAQRADHPVFESLRELIPGHLTPHKAFAQPFGGRRLDGLSVLSVVLPNSQSVVRENAGSIGTPAKSWFRARKEFDRLMPVIRVFLEDFFADRGVDILHVATSDQYRAIGDDDGPCASNWSERHVAYACGLGSFGLHGSLITEVGAAHRLTSVLADCDFDRYGEPSAEPFANCLLLSGRECGACIDRCPAEAISDQGRSMRLCRSVAHDRSRQITPAYVGFKVCGCGLCMTGVPCSTENPMRAVRDADAAPSKEER